MDATFSRGKFARDIFSSLIAFKSMRVSIDATFTRPSREIRSRLFLYSLRVAIFFYSFVVVVVVVCLFVCLFVCFVLFCFAF